jgi:hypothetical protein
MSVDISLPASQSLDIQVCVMQAER